MCWRFEAGYENDGQFKEQSRIKNIQKLNSTSEQQHPKTLNKTL
jgi:hypothetical protein